MAQQTINVADLAVPQLMDVKRQLDQVSSMVSYQLHLSLELFTGVGAFDVVVHPTKAGASKVPIMR
jgi:hypothetical protein